MGTIKTSESEDARLEALAAKQDDAQMRGTPKGARARVMGIRAFQRGLEEMEREAEKRP